MTRQTNLGRRRFLATTATALAGLELTMLGATKPLLNGMGVAADSGLSALRGTTTWLNSPPLTAEGLRGKVVLVDFWTYTCINWLRTLPYVRALAENYLGSERTEGFVSKRDAAKLGLNEWTVAGNWTIGAHAIALNAPNGLVVSRFHARDLHMVLGPAAKGKSVRFRVRIDGQAPGSAHGIDVDGQGQGAVTEQRLYQLIRQSRPIADHQFEIEFLDPGVEAFAF